MTLIGLRTKLAFACGMGLILNIAIASIAGAQPSQDGQWSGVIDWPIQAIHASMLPTGKLLVWQSWRESAGIWDPETQQFSEPSLPEINVFCSSQTWLPDGRLLVVGGHIANNVGESAANIYDPFTDTWANNVAPMNAGRWYPSATTLGDGRVLAMSGDILENNNNQLPQIYDSETNSWQSLTLSQKVLPLFPRTFLTPDGDVASLSNYSNQTEVLDISGTGGWSYIDNTLDSNLNNYGSAVMYEPGKVAFFGGGHNPTANISMMDFNEPNPQWEYSLEGMAQPRRQNDATILADGTVLITGGSSVEGWNDSSGRIPIAEIWDPTTQQTTQVAAASDTYRGYHTTATLLPDGRVLITGGDHDDGAGQVSNRNAEIYSPPYLFNGDRPEISAAPDSAELGRTIFIETADAASIAEVTFLVPGATTHSQNWAQRINHLEFAAVDGGVNVVLPSNPNEAPPGYYMMFLINGNGAPSVAEFIRAELTHTLTGDFNDDGAYACDDVDALVAEVAAGTNGAAFDVNGNGLVDQTDLDDWLATAGAANLASGASYLDGDANLDGTVDGLDFIVWNENKFSSTAAWCSGDFNADGNVDGLDFIVWNDNKFTNSGRSAAVPEPSAVIAAIFGWLCLIRYRHSAR